MSRHEKERQDLFKRIYRNLFQWRSFIESEGPEKRVIRVGTEEIDYEDLMSGYPLLPPRQKQAFDLVLIEGMTEGEATKIMFPGSPWSTPVQQYYKAALRRMIDAYDLCQTKEGRRELRARVEEAEKRRKRREEREREKKRRQEKTETPSEIRRRLLD